MIVTIRLSLDLWTFRFRMESGEMVRMMPLNRFQAAGFFIPNPQMRSPARNESEPLFLRCRHVDRVTGAFVNQFSFCRADCCIDR